MVILEAQQKPQGLAHALRLAINNALEDVAAEVKLIPLVHWSESVFRYFVVRRLLCDNPEIDCWTEWNRVDLLIQREDAAAAVEFKFFGSPELPSRTRGVIRYKGRPSAKNLSEVQAVLEKLRHARTARWTAHCAPVKHAFLVLAYWDNVGRPESATYDSYYAERTFPEVRRRDILLDRAPTPDGRALSCFLMEVRLD